MSVNTDINNLLKKNNINLTDLKNIINSRINYKIKIINIPEYFFNFNKTQLKYLVNNNNLIEKVIIVYKTTYNKKEKSLEILFKNEVNDIYEFDFVYFINNMKYLGIIFDEKTEILLIESSKNIFRFNFQTMKKLEIKQSKQIKQKPNSSKYSTQILYKI